MSVTPTTQWLLDGDDIHAEYADSWATPGAVYTHGTGSDTPLMSAPATGAGSYDTAIYFHADGLGSITGASTGQDSTGFRQSFNSWGQPQGLRLDQVLDHAPYGWAARENDGLGLIYMRARYYSPAQGRFISRDPAGLQGGLNAFAYCDNDPVNCSDPSGLLPQMLANSFSTSYFDRISSELGLSGPTVTWRNPGEKDSDGTQTLQAGLSAASVVPGCQPSGSP